MGERDELEDELYTDEELAAEDYMTEDRAGDFNLTDAMVKGVDMMPGLDDLVPGGVSTTEPLPVVAPAPVADPAIDPMTGLPIEAAPAAPVMVPQLAGSTTSSSTTITKSPESNKLAGEVEENRGELRASGDAQIKSAEAVDKVQAKVDEIDARIMQQSEAAKANVKYQGVLELQGILTRIDQKQVELANLKPEKFWGSKSMSDKIASAVSIGLGSFGAALTGSGQNIGQVLLERQMSEFDRAQEQKFASAVKEIEGMRISAKDKAALIDDKMEILDSIRLSKLAQTKSLYTRQLQMAKTPGVAAKIQQDILKIDNQVLQSQQAVAQHYEKKVQSQETKNVYKMMEKQAGTDANGKPIKLTEQNNKARAAYADMATATQSMKGLDIEKLVTSPEYQTYLQTSRANNAVEAIPYFGPMAAQVNNLVFGSPKENLAKGQLLMKGSPDAARINSGLDNWTAGLIRYKTGAAIAVKEKQEERDQYWPVLGDTPEIIRDKAISRKAIEKAIRQAGALE